MHTYILPVSQNDLFSAISKLLIAEVMCFPKDKISSLAQLKSKNNAERAGEPLSCQKKNPLTALHTSVSAKYWRLNIYQSAWTELAAVCTKTNACVDYLKISDLTNTWLYQLERGPPCVVEPLFVFSQESAVPSQNTEVLRCLNYHLPLLVFTFTF